MPKLEQSIDYFGLIKSTQINTCKDRDKMNLDSNIFSKKKESKNLKNSENVLGSVRQKCLFT